MFATLKTTTGIMVALMLLLVTGIEPAKAKISDDVMSMAIEIEEAFVVEAALLVNRRGKTVLKSRHIVPRSRGQRSRGQR